MLDIWANLSLLIGLVILAGIAWFILYMIGKIIFEDLLGGSYRRIRRKIDKDDQYIY